MEVGRLAYLNPMHNMAHCFIDMVGVLCQVLTCACTVLVSLLDVMDVAWSPHDVWLASCSVDNTIVIWNARKFPGKK